MAMLAEYQFDLFADYHQIFLMVDGVETPDWSSEFNDQTVADRLVVVPHAVVIQPERNLDVPVTVEVRDDAPDDDVTTWDHVTKSSIDVPTVRLVMTDMLAWGHKPDRHFTVPPGTYRVRAYHAALDTLSEDGLDGDEHYRIVIWPGEPCEPDVLKRYTRP